MTTLSFWDQEREPTWYWLFQHLSTTCFTLAGVSFASLFGIFAVPAFKETVPPLVTSLLLIDGALFAFAGEMAREAYFLWKFLATEAAYIVGLVLLLVSYLLFVDSQSAILSNPTVVIAFIGFVILFFCWRIIHNVHVAQRHVKSMPEGAGSESQPKTFKKRVFQRLFRALQFYGLAWALFVVVLFTWIFNKVMDALPLNGQPPPLDWLYYLFSYTLLAAVFLWIVSRVNPLMWRNIAGMLGWKEKEKTKQ